MSNFAILFCNLTGYKTNYVFFRCFQVGLIQVILHILFQQNHIICTGVIEIIYYVFVKFKERFV